MSFFGDLHPYADATPRPYLERALPPGVVSALSTFLIALFAVFLLGAVFIPFPERLEGTFTLVRGSAAEGEPGAAGANPTLVAELSLPELESARLLPGQRVRLLFDAYPYTRYGARGAEVVSMAEAVREGRLLARAALDGETILVGGSARRLVPGLSGVAHVMVGERTLLEWTLEPLRALRDNTRPPPHARLMPSHQTPTAHDAGGASPWRTR